MQHFKNHLKTVFAGRKFTGYLLTSVFIIGAGFLVPVASVSSVVTGLVMAFATFAGAHAVTDTMASKPATPAKALPGPKKDEEEGS